MCKIKDEDDDGYVDDDDLNEIYPDYDELIPDDLSEIDEQLK